MCKKIRFCVLFILLVALAVPAFTAYAADTRVDFAFSRSVATFKRGANGNIAQTPMVTIKGNAEPEKVSGYSVSYKRTHGGDGAKLRISEKATASPNLAGTYTAIITFEQGVPFVCKNGNKSQEYPAAFVIKRAEQAPPVLRSASPALTDNPEKTGGTIKVGSSAVISIAWSSGLKPILTWTSGSDQVITPESGKPARFTAKASGTAILTAVLPEDNNYLASTAAVYTVKVGGANTSNPMYDVVGDSKLQSGWYTSDVTIVGKNGFAKVVSTMGHPVSADGVTTFKFALENESGGTTETFTETIKKDSTGPVIDNFTVNDSPWINPPEEETSAWAATADLVLKVDVLDTASGVAKVEYRLDAGNYINDTNSAFAKEGYTNHEFSLTVDNSGHMLWIRATDTAGNVSVREFLLPKGDDEPASQSNTDSQSTSDSQSASHAQSEKITQPTEPMKAVTARLDYLKRGQIDAKVHGDVRTHAPYIEETLAMFTALTSPEREALGEEALALFRQYFEMLYTIQNKDIAELAPLFVFESLAPPQSESASQSDSSSTSQSASQSSASSLAPSSSQATSGSSSTESVGSQGSLALHFEFNFTYLIPIVVFIFAIIGYFMYKRSLNKKPQFQIPTQDETGEEFSDFKGFDDLDD